MPRSANRHQAEERESGAQRRCARIAEEPGLGVRFISDTEGIEGERGEFRSLATEAIEATIIAKSVR
jgi:hypothetical protein